MAMPRTATRSEIFAAAHRRARLHASFFPERSYAALFGQCLRDAWRIAKTVHPLSFPFRELFGDRRLPGDRTPAPSPVTQATTTITIGWSFSA